MGFEPVVALEIGTSKVLALVGELRDDSHVMITGIGQHRSAGVRKGMITDMDAVRVCVRSALESAEQSGDVTIREVVLAVSGGHITGEVNRGTVAVLDPEGEISEGDVEAVYEVASAIPLAHDRLVIHTLYQLFAVDGQERIVSPEGMEGSKLSLDVLILHGRRSSVNAVTKAVRDVPMQVQDTAFSGWCAAMALLTEEQKQTGALVIDIGGGTTDYCVYLDGVVITAGSFGVGGDHVTNDIVRAFTIPTQRAEELKKKSGSALVDDDDEQTISLPPDVGFPARVLRVKMLNRVINARMDELLQLVRGRVEEAGVLNQLGSGVILSGGSSHLRQLPELAARVFGLPCSIGRLSNISGKVTMLDEPEFAVCCGLVQYAFKSLLDSSEESTFREIIRRFIGK